MKTLSKPVFTNPLRVFLHTAWVLISHELRHNRLAYILPSFIACFLWLGSFFFKTLPVSKTVQQMSLIGLYLILAMLYGLLAFSSDKDKKTLDFMISRPIPPSLILGVKYGCSVVVLFFWYLLFRHLFPIHWESLPLPKGVNEHWLTLLILVIHAISLLAGLQSKGLERFFIVIVTTSGMAYLSYFIWDHLFQLMTANYYWYDIPPVLMKTVTAGIPIFLTVLSLLVPLTATLWQLRNRLPFLQFRPGQFTVAVWLLTFLALGLIHIIFAPVIYPQPTAKYGDWHETSGIILAKAVNPDYAFHRVPDDRLVPCELVLSKPNRKSRILYRGNNLMFPRFSPNGQSVVFSEADELQIIDLKTKKKTNVGPGRIGAWSDDGRRIIFNRLIGPNGLSELYIYDCSDQSLRQLTPQTFHIADLLWNSSQDELLIVDYDQSIHHYNLADHSVHTTSFHDIDELHVVFGITRPLIRLDPEQKRIFLGYILQGSLKVYQYDPVNREFRFSEQITNFRMKPNAPILLKPDFSALLWPRIDGGFTYEATKYHVDHEHEHDHEHCDDPSHHH